MKKKLLHLKNIIRGNEQFTDRQKYSLMIYSVACVHLFLVCIFIYLNIMPLYLFNIGSVLTYLFSTRFIREEKYLTVYYITYFEIILHSVAATLCIGWQFGFAQYIIAIIPVGYYTGYMIDAKRRSLLIATQNAIFAAALFLACKSFSYYHKPFYSIEDPAVELFLYFFNSICTFVFLIVFSLIYILEIKLSHAKLRHQNGILEQLAYTDPLTGLHNRRSMQLFIEQALKSDFNFSLIMGDIDDFKKINDTYGHDFGDVALHDIAQIALEQVSEHGYVCRWGGEEILILVNNCSAEKTVQIAEDIRRNVEQHVFRLGERLIHCTLTLGVASYERGKTIEETITNADSKLYRGKQNGKNVVVA